MRRTADQLIANVQQICLMDMAYLGENDTVRKTVMYDYLSLAMHALAKNANQVAYTDTLTISADGAATFKVSGVNVDDMFQPLRVIDTGSGQEARHSQSFAFTNGWFWDGSAQSLYVKGLRGTFSLHYVKYPAWITAGSQIPEFPPSGYMSLIYETAALIKQSKNYYEEANAMKEQARTTYGAIEDASKLGGV